MGRARSNGYRLDSPCPDSSIANGRPPAPSGSRPSAAPSHRRAAPTTHQGAGRGRDRLSRNRRPKHTGCRNPQVRKGIGSCVFVLGIPCLIAGLILTIVSSSNDGKYPATFPVVGPVLLVLAVLCFIIGVLLYNIVLWQSLRDFFSLSDKDSFCRRHFPRLSAWLKPDMVRTLNQTAINNLQTAPTRSALRKVPNPDLVTMETEVDGGQGHRNPSQGSGNFHHHPNNRHGLPLRRKRAVTFSEGDGDLEGELAGGRLNSVSSGELDRMSVQSENGGGSVVGGSLNGQSPSSSLLSVRHCKVHPKDDVFWTESSVDNVDGDDGGGGGDDGGGGHPSGSDSVSVLDSSSSDGAVAAEDDGAAALSVKFPLGDIDEERA